MSLINNNNTNNYTNTDNNNNTNLIPILQKILKPEYVNHSNDWLTGCKPSEKKAYI